MKKLLLISLALCATQFVYSQVNMILLLEGESEYQKIEYSKQTNETLIGISKSVIKEIPKNKITRQQTLGVHFSEDSYDNFLANKSKRLDFDKLGKTKTSGLHISGRTSSDSLVILFKIKIGSGGERGIDPYKLNFYEGDIFSVLLINGDTVNLKIYNPYFLTGWGATVYNFGYLIPTMAETYKLVNSRIEGIYLSGVEFKILDGYLIMRHLLALIDNNSFDY